MATRRKNYTISFEDWTSKILPAYKDDDSLKEGILEDWCNEDKIIIFENGKDSVDRFWFQYNQCFDDSLLDGWYYTEEEKQVISKTELFKKRRKFVKYGVDYITTEDVKKYLDNIKTVVDSALDLFEKIDISHLDNIRESFAVLKGLSDDLN